MKVGVAVTCAVCGDMEKPRGRSGPMGMSFCEPLWNGRGCAGYDQDPQPGTLWPGESDEDFRLSGECARVEAGGAGGAAMTWQPIDTAPKDGTPVLLWEPEENLRHDGIAMVGEYVAFTEPAPAGYHSGWFDNVNGRHEIMPTHWMPLPDPPSEGPR